MAIYVLFLKPFLPTRDLKTHLHYIFQDHHPKQSSISIVIAIPRQKLPIDSNVPTSECSRSSETLSSPVSDSSTGLPLADIGANPTVPQFFTCLGHSRKRFLLRASPGFVLAKIAKSFSSIFYREGFLYLQACQLLFVFRTALVIANMRSSRLRSSSCS